MSMIQFRMAGRETTPVGKIVRFSVYEGDGDDMVFCGLLAMSAAKFDAMKFGLMLHAAKFPEQLQFDVQDNLERKS